jgi:hypothetical protein
LVYSVDLREVPFEAMSYRRKYPRQFVGWRCRTCGCAGITGAKDMENLIRGIRRHHNEKSPGCDFSRENVAIHEPHASSTESNVAYQPGLIPA